MQNICIFKIYKWYIIWYLNYNLFNLVIFRDEKKFRYEIIVCNSLMIIHQIFRLNQLLLNFWLNKCSFFSIKLNWSDFDFRISVIWIRNSFILKNRLRRYWTKYHLYSWSINFNLRNFWNFSIWILYLNSLIFAKMRQYHRSDFWYWFKYSW